MNGDARWKENALSFTFKMSELSVSNAPGNTFLSVSFDEASRRSPRDKQLERSRIASHVARLRHRRRILQQSATPNLVDGSAKNTCACGHQVVCDGSHCLLHCARPTGRGKLATPLERHLGGQNPFATNGSNETPLICHEALAWG